MSGDPVAVRVFVRGRVQGVGFRDETRRIARKEGVSGWVRNLADGRVEAWFEGGRDAVDRVATWCERGPSWTTVVGVDVVDESPAGYDGFSVR